jgi:hypothetical protein
MSNHRQLHPAVISRKLFYILQNVKLLLSDVNLFLFFLKKFAIFCSRQHVAACLWFQNEVAIPRLFKISQVLLLSAALYQVLMVPK